MYYTINESDYWVEVTGEGPPIVLLHGFTGSTHTWHEVTEALRSSRIKLIVIDLPGHGKTRYREGRLLSMENCCKDLKMLFDKLELKDITLLGYSMGGRTALSFVSWYPRYVKRLVLESASPGLMTEDERKEREQKDEKLARKLEDQGIEAFVDFWETLPLFHSQKLLAEEVQDNIRKERLSQSAAGLALSLRGMGTGVQPSQWERLRDVTVPVQLLVGEWDEKFVTINKRMEKELPHARLDVLPDSGHAVHVELPKLFAEIVRDFMLK